MPRTPRTTYPRKIPLKKILKDMMGEMTADELARKISLDSQDIRQVLAGRCSLPPKTVKRIAKALGQCPEEILELYAGAIDKAIEGIVGEYLKHVEPVFRRETACRLGEWFIYLNTPKAVTRKKLERIYGKRQADNTKL